MHFYKGVHTQDLLQSTEPYFTVKGANVLIAHRAFSTGFHASWLTLISRLPSQIKGGGLAGP